MCLHPCSQPTLSWSPREPWELPGTGSQMGRQRLPRASFGLVVMSGTSRRPVHLRASFPLFRSRSRGSRLWTISFFIAPGRRMKLTYSVDMGASLGPGGQGGRSGNTHHLGARHAWIRFQETQPTHPEMHPRTTGSLTQDTCLPQTDTHSHL